MHNASGRGHDGVTGARIGPNALIQTVKALGEQYPLAQVDAILHQCNQEALLSTTPTTMVDEEAFAALVVAVVDQIGVSQAHQILWRSGQLTADYLLHHRIPGLFQWLLRPLPHRPALKLLLLAIRQHAWTFVGSGRFSYTVGAIPQLTVVTRLTPAAAVCGFYGGTFDHLIRALIAPQAQTAIDTAVCEGLSCCCYTIHLEYAPVQDGVQRNRAQPSAPAHIH